MTNKNICVKNTKKKILDKKYKGCFQIQIIVPERLFGTLELDVMTGSPLLEAYHHRVKWGQKMKIEAEAKAESRGATGFELRTHHVIPAAAKSTKS